MANIPKRVEERIKTGVRNYSKILEQVKRRDINESDTVTVVSDMLSDIFGYDKYMEITKEYAIRNTYCDLAIKQGDDVIYLIECKAIGIELKEEHLRQAIEYSATKGIDWAILTNGQTWKVYKVIYGKPIRTEEVFSLDFLASSVRDTEFIAKIYVLTKEALSKSVIEAYHEKAQLVNKFMISAVLLSEEVGKFIRSKLKSISKEVKTDTETIQNILRDEVIKRDIMDSDEIRLATQKVKRCLRRNAKPTKAKETVLSSGEGLSSSLES